MSRTDKPFKVGLYVGRFQPFHTGHLHVLQKAAAIVPNVVEKIKSYTLDNVIFTMDTHFSDYLETQEGKNLPVKHCIVGTAGYELAAELADLACDSANIIKKLTFGYKDWNKFLERYKEPIDSIELVGLCTDICVISNALILKACLPEVPITVDASCCAGVTVESHKNALAAMKMCQINIINC